MKKPRTPAPTVFDRVQVILDSAQTHAARSVNTTQVVANWLIGREIVEEQQQGAKRAGYGDQVVAQLADQLKECGVKGYGYLTLNLCRQFHLSYPDLLGAQICHALRGKLASAKGLSGILYAVRKELPGPTAPPRNLYAARKQSGKKDDTEIVYALRNKSTPSESTSLVPRIIEAVGSADWQPGLLHPGLSWTHYRTLMRVSSPHARAFYEIEAIQQNWSARELERQINSLLFERLAKSRDKAGLMKLATKGQEIATSSDVFKDPVVIEFLGLPESHRLVESDLEQALINNLQDFLLELGKGFAFVSRQERITLDGDHFYIDLVFYHTVLKCYVLIDLKVGKLTHGDLGQMQLYANYFDQERRTEGDNPTLGLILCTDKNDAVVKYLLGPDQSKKIFTSRYKLHLPTEAELATELKRELKELR